jgi:hypothetical protein
MLYLRHNNATGNEYHTLPSKYFGEEMLERFDFITLNLQKGGCEGVKKTGVYIIPVHKKKALESNFTEHIYYENAEMLKPYKVLLKGVQRFYCVKCDRLARIIKNEYKRPKNAEECWSCFHEIR